MKNDKCNRTSSFKDVNGYEQYYPCDKKPYCEVTYMSGLNSKVITETMCKRHFNALNKNAIRVQKVTGFDCKISFKLI